MSEGNGTRGMSQREILLEMRADLKTLMNANLVERMGEVEDNQRWAWRTIAANFIGILITAAIFALKVTP